MSPVGRSALRHALLLAAALPLGAPCMAGTHQGGSFTYQGRIEVSGVPYTGTCSFTFQYYDVAGTGTPPTGGVLLGSSTFPGTAVKAGLFTITTPPSAHELFLGDEVWIGISAACPAGAPSTALSPRQLIRSVPYASALPGLRTAAAGAGEAPAIIGGFATNDASVDFGAYEGAVVAGGGRNLHPNLVTGPFGTISGGFDNTATNVSVVGGGFQNHADGLSSTIPGGAKNTASGDYTFAAGWRAKAVDKGAFVWADSTDLDFSSTTANSFKVRATGGVRFVAAVDGFGDTTWSCVFGNGSSWACSSDRDAKENFEAVDGAEALERVAKLPILRWNAKGTDPSVKHMGPMAQDFRSAFRLGDDEKVISTIDLDGVALAAIQGAKAEIDALKTRNEELDRRNRELEARLSALECAVADRGPR